MTKTLPTSISCVGYCRVSTERQAGETFSSLADQQTAIAQLAQRLGLTVGVWYRDEGASGGTIDRPAFMELIHTCEASQRSPRAPGHILVLNDSRFGRFPDPDEAAAVRWRLKQAGWLVRFCEGDDVRDITFRSVIRSLGSAQASEYRRNIQCNARRGARGTAEQGFWGREAPFGYRRRVAYPPGLERVLEPGQRKATNERVALSVHAEEAAIVRWIFETYAAGGTSLGQVAEELKRRAPGRRWGRTVVGHLIVNEAYVGDVMGGRRHADKTERLATPVRPESEWYGKRDAHEPIVSRELFAAARARLGENKRLSTRGTVTYLLTRVLQCPHCSSYYCGGGLANKSRNADPLRCRAYRDYGGITGICPGRIGTVMRHLVDDAVVRTLGATLRSSPVRRRIVEEVDRALYGGMPDAEHALAGITTQEQRARERRERLAAAIADGTLQRAEAAQQIERIRQELEQLNAQRAGIRMAERKAQTASAERERLISLATDFARVAAQLSGPALRNLVLPWIDHATFDKVSRVLTLGIRRIPAVSVLASGRPGQAVREQGGHPFIRRIPLLQSAHAYRAREAAEAIERARAAGGGR